MPLPANMTAEFHILTRGKCATPVKSMAWCGVAAEYTGLPDTIPEDDRQARGVWWDPPYCTPAG